MIGVLVRLEIENKRGKSENAERGGGENCALQAMRGFLAQHFSWRPGRAGEVIRNGVEKPLDAGRRFQRTELAKLRRRNLGGFGHREDKMRIVRGKSPVSRLIYEPQIPRRLGKGG